MVWLTKNASLLLYVQCALDMISRVFQKRLYVHAAQVPDIGTQSNSYPAAVALAQWRIHLLIGTYNATPTTVAL